ncbi:hypothetical protein CFN78_26665 [Amycolatopsis antarctica]|uniref:Uncharacterized protein n=1 Tax=Amycolatopsis antarctica TaxID=1854586 RepID=A0A263CXU8_9PSEU|nr:hypothetical protein [Amycolatopsis antarctica]OZM70156.1 hypothetical protein CFN78_26665 [Amycolatopsis antarctica]
MRKAIQFLGLYLVVAGISGTIDHLAFQPILNPILNAFNRFVIPHIDALTGFEVYANLTVSVIGVVVLVIAERAGRRTSGAR